MLTPLFLGTWEIVIIVVIVLLLFGGKKIPELMKGLGQGISSFKSGLKEGKDEQAKKEQAKIEEAKKEENKAE